MADYIITGFSLMILVFYLIILFLLFEIKMRIEGGFGRSFIYMIIAVIILIALRIESILEKFEYFSIVYLHESLAVLFSLLFLLSIYNFYRNVCEVTDRKIKNHKKKKQIEKIISQKSQTSKKSIQIKKPQKIQKSFFDFKRKNVNSGGYLDLTK